MSEIASELELITSINIDGITYDIKKKLGGDLKNMAIIMGIVAANGTYACLWCHINLKETVVYENEYPIERTQAQATKYYATKKLGYFNKPIFSFIEFEDVVIDMLHLHLRITDKLFDCLMDVMIRYDENAEFDLDQRISLKMFESFLAFNCNITNPFVYNQRGEGNKIKLRTLDAKERVKIFEKLFEEGNRGFTDLFANCDILEENDGFQHENFVWNEFRKIYNQLKALDDGESLIDTFDMDSFKTNLKRWLYFYKKIDTMENTSPYVHAFVFHMPEFLIRHGSINLYNCQGLEKLNDISTKLYHNSTNKNKTDKKYLVQLIKKMNRMEFYNLNDNIDVLYEFLN